MAVVIGSVGRTDGSDEPGTSACAHLFADAKFYCMNKQHRGRYVPSSRVDDGVCDCCDGSDESSATCPDTCGAEAAASRVEDRERIATLESGARAKQGYVARAAEAKATAEAEAKAREAEVAAAKASLAELEAKGAGLAADAAEARGKHRTAAALRVLARFPALGSVARVAGLAEGMAEGPGDGPGGSGSAATLASLGLDELRALLVDYARIVDKKGRALMRLVTGAAGDEEDEEDEDSGGSGFDDAEVYSDDGYGGYGGGDDLSGSLDEEESWQDHSSSYGDPHDDEYGGDRFSGDEYGGSGGFADHDHYGGYHDEYGSSTELDDDHGGDDSSAVTATVDAEDGATEKTQGGGGGGAYEPFESINAFGDTDGEDGKADGGGGEGGEVSLANLGEAGAEAGVEAGGEAGAEAGAEAGGDFSDDGVAVPGKVTWDDDAKSPAGEDTAADSASAAGAGGDAGEEDLLRDPDEPPAVAAYRDYKKAVAAAKANLKALEKRVAKAASKGGKVGGSFAEEYGDDGALWALKGQCFSLDHQQYTYEVCPFGEAHQKDKGATYGGTLLGRWAGLVHGAGPVDARRGLPGTAFAFMGGQWCGASGSDRKATVLLACGPEERLVSVDEPATCIYELTMQTPVACDVAMAQSLRLDLSGDGDGDSGGVSGSGLEGNGRGHEEL